MFPFLLYFIVITSWALGGGGSANRKDFHSSWDGSEGRPCRVIGAATLEEKVFGILPSTRNICRDQVKDPVRVFEVLGMAWEAVEGGVRA